MATHGEPRRPMPNGIRVTLRPVGSPLTIGMAGLAIASLVQSGLDLRWVAIDQTHPAGLILLSVPFVAQLVAAVFCYLARDGSTGAATGVLSVSWLALGLVHLSSTPGSRSGALGLMLLASGAVLVLSAVAVAVAKPLPAAVFGLAGARFVLSGIDQLGAASPWRHAAGIVGLVVVGLAGYCVIAFELEGQRHRSVLPTLRRGSGRLPADVSSDGPIGPVEAEPGVRQTT